MRSLAGVLGDRPNTCGIKTYKVVRVEARSLKLPQKIQSGSYLHNYLSNMRVPFQIFRDEETQKFGTLNNLMFLLLMMTSGNERLDLAKQVCNSLHFASFSWNRST